MTANPFPNPEGKINVLKRCLHIIAMLQFIPDNKETWNSNSLTEILSLDEISDDGLQDEVVKKYVNNQIKKGFFIDIDKNIKLKPSVWSVAEDIDEKTQLEFARVYADFVIKDRSRDIALKKFIEAIPDRALWTLARVHFAVIQKRLIQIDYSNSSGGKRSDWKLCPCYFFISEFSLYLAAYDPVEDLRFTLRAERIEKLIVLEKSRIKGWKIPPIGTMYKNSISAFLSPGGPVTMKIRYKKNAASDIESFISPLSTKTISPEKDSWIEAKFVVEDYIYLCKQLFIYGNNVEILSPPEVRQAMKNMLKRSMSVYEDL